jgi:general secretion pathway protein B
VSYILEALRKAEQKREQDEPSKVPTFLSGIPRESERRMKLWPYIVAVALLLNGSLVLWRLLPRQTTPTSPSPATMARQGGQETPEVSRTPSGDVHKPASSPVPRKENAPAVAERALQKRAVEPEAPAVVFQPRVEQSQPLPVPRPSSVNELSEPVAPARNGKPRASGRLLSLTELPPSVRGALPEFKISGHAFTPEPQTRVVRINERILQEGQELSPGLRVEEIVQGGVIMNYDGYRFRINIKEN